MVDCAARLEVEPISASTKLLDMLTDYAAAHQHPINIAVHMVGIPTIMLGALIALSWLRVDIGSYAINGAYVTTLVFFAFYLSLDRWFSIVFLLLAAPMAYIATVIGSGPNAVMIASVSFIGGYVAQFVGHAIEKSAPVLLRHPIQANLAAPFFTVVELFKITGLRDDLFNELQARIAKTQHEQIV